VGRRKRTGWKGRKEVKSMGMAGRKKVSWAIHKLVRSFWGKSRKARKES